MVLGFKNQFQDKILSGSKIHTIREDKNNRWKVGNKIHFATGVRTKNYNQFAEGVCTETEAFEIRYTTKGIVKTANIFINSKLEGQAIWNNGTFKYASFSVDMIARNDGFQRTEDFFNWFNKDFKGKIIYWELNKQIYAISSSVTSVRRFKP